MNPILYMGKLRHTEGEGEQGVNTADALDLKQGAALLCRLHTLSPTLICTISFFPSSLPPPTPPNPGTRISFTLRRTSEKPSASLGLSFPIC